MADSKLRKSYKFAADDLVQCGICFAVLDNPKALPCLHTYCLQCLASWAESSAKKNPEKYTTTISCPDCREEFPLPKGGVKELKTNFVVNKLKERTLIQKRLNDKEANIPCTSCDLTESKAVGRCVECDDFICKQCVDNHKGMRALRNHHVLTLQELRAGKLTMHNLPEQEICPKHSGEVLRFYCETCDEPMCRDCTVLDHPRQGHKQTDLKSAAAERSDKLKELFSQTNQVPNAIKLVVAEDREILKALKSNAKRAIQQYKETAKKAEEECIKSIHGMVAKTEKEIEDIVRKREKEIEAHQESLQFQNARLKTALEMTSQVTENGSEHDVATMYASLADTMQKLSKLKPKSVRKSMGKVDFTANKDLTHGVDSLGALNTYEQWTLDKTFGQGQFSSGRDIVIDANGDIMVATFTSGHYIKVFGDDGDYKRQVVTSGMGGGVYVPGFGYQHDQTGNSYPFVTSGMGGNLYEADYGYQTVNYGYQTVNSYPFGMVLLQSGDLYVADQNTFVTVISGSNGTYKNRFYVQHPNGSSSQNNYGWQLYGLASDTKGHLYVGCTNQSYISICDQNGGHVSSFQVNVQPWFIAVANEDHIIVSSHANQAVHVYDTKGTQRHTFKPPPEGSFRPTGLCVVGDEVFVASYTGIRAVYRYTLTGEYLGVVTKDVTNPWGLKVTDDGERLVVCEDNCIKVFSP